MLAWVLITLNGYIFCCGNVVLIMDPSVIYRFCVDFKAYRPEKRRRVLIRELIFALLIMLAFLYAGEAILSFLNLRSESVSIAGGIILF